MLRRFKLELYDIETASFTLKVRMLKSDVVETPLLYGRVTWTLGVEHFAELQSAHRKLLVRSIGFHRRQRIDHRMSRMPRPSTRHNARALKRVSTWRLLHVGAVQRA